PLLVLVLAIGSGARTFAGEEDAGRLELVLAYPVRRRASVLAKGAAVAAEVAAICASSGIAIGVLNPIFDLGLSTGHVAQAVGCSRGLPSRSAQSPGVAGSRSPYRQVSRPRAISSRVCIRSPAGSTRSACFPCFGGSVQRRSRTAFAGGVRWSWASRRWSPSS